MGAEGAAAERTPSADGWTIELLRDGGRAAGFSCGNPELDAFLAAGEFLQFDQEQLGRTYVAFRDGVMVGYFTVSAAELRAEYLGPGGAWNGVGAARVEGIPAFKIGRFAIDGRLQRRGFGRALLQRVVGMALVAGDTIGVRLVVLQAKPASVPFYRAAGFQFTVSTKRERRRENRTMFLDLKRVAPDPTPQHPPPVG